MPCLRLALLVLLLVPVRVFCQISMGDSTMVHPRFYEPNLTTPADLNGDGHIDLMFRSTDDGLAFCLNDGTGQLLLPQIFPHQIADGNVLVPDGFQLVDYDLDGDLDVLTANNLSDQFRLHLNDGAAVFSPAQVLVEDINSPAPFHAADWDDDGDLDIISSTNPEGLVYIEQTASGEFAAPVPWSPGIYASAEILSADVNADGLLDVVHANFVGDYIGVFFNDGAGGFSEQSILPGDPDPPSKMALADYNMDGTLDIAYAANWDYQIGWYSNDGNGNFTLEPIVAEDVWDAALVNAGDFDGDGDPDLLSCAPSSWQLTWYENDGTGTFTVQPEISTGSREPLAAFSVDLDNDGDLEVGFTMNASHRLTWYDNLGEGAFGEPNYITFGVRELEHFALMDVDQDGLMDVVTSSSHDHVAWFRRRESGAYDDPIVVSDNGGNYGYLVVADFNGDGLDDVFANGANHLQLMTGLEGGGLSAETFVDYYQGLNMMLAVDLDQDGDQDVLAINQFDEDVVWFDNDGSGNFEKRYAATDFINPEAVSCADLDGDGDLDITCVTQNPSSTVWFENDGEQNFSAPVVIHDNAPFMNFVLAVDIDADGDQDIYACSTEELWFYRNDGTGNFTNHLMAVGLRFATELDAGDMDNDGDLDLVLAEVNKDILVFENDGLGGLEVYRIPIAYHSPWHVRTHDFDQDGDLEIAYAAHSRVGIFDNTHGEGCTDPAACNYNPVSWIDNGTCCVGVCGCSDPEASNYNPEATCDQGECLYKLAGFVFNDISSDGNYQTWDDETPLAYQSVLIQPGDLLLITNDEGQFETHLPAGEYYVSGVPNDNFPFLTTETPLEVSIPQDETCDLEVGLSADAPAFGICVDFYPTGGTFLCDDWVVHNICFRNMGNQAIDGIVEVEYDTLFQGHQEITPIDSVNGNVVYMSFEDLGPGQMFFYDLLLHTPTVDFIGEQVTSYARVTGFFDGLEVGYGAQELSMPVLCAYDPNDKQVFPQGESSDHRVLNDTELEYLIRFQNTGNAPAQTVLLRDTLDPGLDIGTFELMANSHSVMTSVDPWTREVVFLFEDINLPDSTCCVEESQGLVSYVIRPLPELEAETRIENTAYIYFDNNPPIVTNTTWSTIHYCAPALNGTVTTVEDCPGDAVNIATDYNLEIDWESWFNWTSEGALLGTNPTLSLAPNYPASPLINLTVENPLCTESWEGEVPIDLAFNWTTCTGDLDCNGEVDALDVLVFLAEFGCTGIPCRYDLDGSGESTSSDLLIVLGEYGSICPE